MKGNAKKYKTSDIERFIKKLRSVFEVERDEGKRHHHLVLRYANKTIVNSQLSRNKVVNLGGMKSQFRLQMKEMKDLFECPMTAKTYLDILKAKDMI